MNHLIYNAQGFCLRLLEKEFLERQCMAIHINFVQVSGGIDQNANQMSSINMRDVVKDFKFDFFVLLLT